MILPRFHKVKNEVLDLGLVTNLFVDPNKMILKADKVAGVFYDVHVYFSNTKKITYERIFQDEEQKERFCKAFLKMCKEVLAEIIEENRK